MRSEMEVPVKAGLNIKSEKNGQKKLVELLAKKKTYFGIETTILSCGLIKKKYEKKKVSKN
jgi:hypothetical protein